uniref:hypothetical protein n=1 Tax=Halomonas sp. TaxID=1486246 RepID=UPI00261AE390|nr:hypothetical protein [Halomonas sp.]
MHGQWSKYKDRGQLVASDRQAKTQPLLKHGYYAGITLIGLMACSLSTSLSAQETSQAESADNTTTAPTNTLTSTPSNTLPTLNSTIPLEITSTKSPVTLESLQHDFDVFSWQSFIALNWPATADGQPNNDMVIGQDPGGPVVWQSWRESRSIFLPGGAQPPAWGQGSAVPEVCQGIDPDSIPPGTLHLTQVGKTPDVLDESEEPFETGPLIDQNGQYTRYEILTNETMFNYVLDNQLYSKAGQQTFDKTNDVAFPSSNTKTQEVGSIMLKAAWIIMGGKYDETKYHTSYALVYNNPAEQPGVKPACSLEKVGLVGFHIAHKTQKEPQWVWSTFEHVANVPTQHEKPQLSAYNFYDASCTDCPVNEPPPRPWNPGNSHSPPSQIERVIPITADTKALNELYHKALSTAVPDSVWVNYELVSTQWPTNAKSTTDPTGVPAPSFLANTTLETYIQGEVKQTSSSCMACHNNATDTAGAFSDFTYLLQRAQ